MISIRSFTAEYLQDAHRIALDNYNEERSAVSALPKIDRVPDLREFADNGLGVVAIDHGATVGFLCSYRPWERAFNSTATGTFSPIHAHGAVKENRGLIYRIMYQAAAEKWVEQKITYHAIGLYAHDSEAIGSLFTFGFGLRCIDAIRFMENIDAPLCRDVVFSQLPKTDVVKIRDMRRMLSEYLGNSPCFMYSSSQDFASWLAKAETRNSRIFAAECGETPVAFLEIAEDGAENFVTEVSDMRNICGAFCLPELRGKGIMQGLINHTVSVLRAEGYVRLGVDFESFNPTGYGFWMKHFTSTQTASSGG